MKQDEPRLSAPELSMSRPLSSLPLDSSLTVVSALLLLGLPGCITSDGSRGGKGHDAQDTGEEEGPLPEDDGGAEGDTGSGPEENVYPRTCQDVAEANPSASDDYFTLYVDGDPSMPWRAWCAEIPQNPKAFIALEALEGGANTAFYPCDGATEGTDVETLVYGVAIDAETLRVDSLDLTYSESYGHCNTFTELTELPWGFAGTCNGEPSGFANLDLTGTPFVIEEGAFALDGYNPAGEAEYSDGGRRVDLNGGGSCGSMSPEADDGNIQLVYSP